MVQLSLTADSQSADIGHGVPKSADIHRRREKTITNFDRALCKNYNTYE